MKNCLVIAGEYRTFDQTYETIAKFAAINDLDIYCHLWAKDETEVKDVEEKLNPTSIKWDSFNEFEEGFVKMEKRIKNANPKWPNQDRIVNQASMNYSRKIAYESVPKDKYDYVVFARYDLLFLRPFTIQWKPHTVVTAVAQSWGLISDVFVVLPSKYAQHFFLYNEYERLRSTPFEEDFIDYLRYDFKYGDNNIRIHRDERYCPHMILIRNFFLNRVPWCLDDFPVDILR